MVHLYFSPGCRGCGGDEGPLRLEGALVDLLELRVGLGDTGELEGDHP